jgi:hypothetical protein
MDFLPNEFCVVNWTGGLLLGDKELVSILSMFDDVHLLVLVFSFGELLLELIVLSVLVLLLLLLLFEWICW